MSCVVKTRVPNTLPEYMAGFLKEQTDCDGASRMAYYTATTY